MREAYLFIITFVFFESVEAQNFTITLRFWEGTELCNIYF